MTYKILKPEVQERWSHPSDIITEADLIKVLKAKALENNDEMTPDRITHSLTEYVANGIIAEHKGKELPAENPVVNKAE